MKVLLIDNDLDSGRDLVRALHSEACPVNWVRHGMATAMASRSIYSVILLDTSSSNASGVDILRNFRASNIETPIIVLTDQVGIETRVSSLDLGADDVLTRPFDVRELLARVRAILRRKAGYASSEIGDEKLKLNLITRQLRYNGQVHTLSAREFDLIIALLERPGTIVSRSTLEDRLYGCGRDVESNAVDVLIYGIRKKFSSAVILNVRGAGWTIPIGIRSDPVVLRERDGRAGVDYSWSNEQVEQMFC
ncbi:response regulator transcription factor [Paraburkholderia sp. RL17-373-BIF-A]|uniref:response regulator transcription factor n=1 Tax=Paraburkholderia sp. RL17-373-BIF-A TaxID=3031629 RepID=UPI0038B79702